MTKSQTLAGKPTMTQMDKNMTHIPLQYAIFDLRAYRLCVMDPCQLVYSIQRHASDNSNNCLKGTKKAVIHQI